LQTGTNATAQPLIKFRQMLIKSVNGKTPLIPEDCYVAENAIVGDVSFGESCSVWFNAVIRGRRHSNSNSKYSGWSDYSLHKSIPQS
jgi:hypothetical protein